MSIIAKDTGSILDFDELGNIISDSSPNTIRVDAIGRKYKRCSSCRGWFLLDKFSKTDDPCLSGGVVDTCKSCEITKLEKLCKRRNEEVIYVNGNPINKESIEDMKNKVYSTDTKQELSWDVNMHRVKAGESPKIRLDCKGRHYKQCANCHEWKLVSEFPESNHPKALEGKSRFCNFCTQSGSIKKVKKPKVKTSEIPEDKVEEVSNPNTKTPIPEGKVEEVKKSDHYCDLIDELEKSGKYVVIPSLNNISSNPEDSESNSKLISLCINILDKLEVKHVESDKDSYELDCSIDLNKIPDEDLIDELDKRGWEPNGKPDIKKLSDSELTEELSRRGIKCLSNLTNVELISEVSNRGLDKVDKSDEELLGELKSRGYSGQLKLTKTVDL
jgi:hypothetical protein